MDALAENDAMMIRTTGGQTITGGAATTFTLDQDNDQIGMFIDSEATSASKQAFVINGKYCHEINQNIVGGRTGYFRRTGAGAESNPCVEIDSANASASQAVLHVRQTNGGDDSTVLLVENAGSGNDIQAGATFILKNGYIAPGGNEGLRWDVVELNMDVSEEPESIGYTLDGLKCVGMTAIGYLVSTDFLRATTDESNNLYISATHDGANLVIHYGATYSDGDDARIIVFTKA